MDPFVKLDDFRSNGSRDIRGPILCRTNDRTNITEAYGVRRKRLSGVSPTKVQKCSETIGRYLPLFFEGGGRRPRPRLVFIGPLLLAIFL